MPNTALRHRSYISGVLDIDVSNAQFQKSCVPGVEGDR